MSHEPPNLRDRVLSERNHLCLPRASVCRDCYINQSEHDIPTESHVRLMRVVYAIRNPPDHAQWVVCCTPQYVPVLGSPTAQDRGIDRERCRSNALRGKCRLGKSSGADAVGAKHRFLKRERGPDCTREAHRVSWSHEPTRARLVCGAWRREEIFRQDAVRGGDDGARQRLRFGNNTAVGRGLDRGNNDDVGCTPQRQHVGRWIGETKQTVNALRGSALGDAADLFRVAFIVAWDHENGAAEPAIEQHTDSIDKGDVTASRPDAPGRKKDPLSSADAPSVADSRGVFA